MPSPSVPLEKLGFLTIGLFDPDDPRPGHETTLGIIELGEQLGFDSAWVRHRHLQHGISSPVAVLAAATQRTQRIELGTAVIPLGWENPLRLAEDLATDRKSTRLNSSHANISYAVFCLKTTHPHHPARTTSPLPYARPSAAGCATAFAAPSRHKRPETC